MGVFSFDFTRLAVRVVLLTVLVVTITF